MCFFLEVCYVFMLYMQPKMYTINYKKVIFEPQEGNWVMSPRVASDGLWTVVATEKALLLKATTEALTQKRKVTSTMTLFLFLKFISLFFFPPPGKSILAGSSTFGSGQHVNAVRRKERYFPKNISKDSWYVVQLRKKKRKPWHCLFVWIIRMSIYSGSV